MRAGSIGGGYGIPRFEDRKRWDVGHGDCTGLRDYRGQRSDCRGQIAEMGGRQKANNGTTKIFVAIPICTYKLCRGNKRKEFGDFCEVKRGLTRCAMEAGSLLGRSRASFR